MQREEAIKLLKYIGISTADNLSEILEPVSKYGKSIGLLIKAVKDGVNEYSLNALKEDAKKEVRDAVDKEPVPNYMDCMIFFCKEGCRLDDAQKERLQQILTLQLADGDVESRKRIDEFVADYMGGEINLDSEDECEIGEDFIGFNFCDMLGTQEFPYNREYAELVMGALNKLLGEELFDWCLIDGHMDSIVL